MNEHPDLMYQLVALRQAEARREAEVWRQYRSLRRDDRETSRGSRRRSLSPLAALPGFIVAGLTRRQRLALHHHQR